MIQVQTGSRLHFGLLSLPAEKYWPNHHGEEVVPSQRFGGVGLMVDRPGLRLSVSPAQSWSAAGPLAERALAFANRFAESTAPQTGSPQHLRIETDAREHVGLGTGTQLGLAVARALTAAWQLPEVDTAELARRVGRGRRSALGIHGFVHGGFLVEAGQGERPGIAPLVARFDFPAEWRLVLVIPASEKGLHGPAEIQAFELLHQQSPERTDALCRLVLLGMLPALVERDLPAFGEALFDFNARVGELFAAAQGGTYASPRLAEIVTWLRQQGVRGVGQSSWGPTLFAVVADDDEAARLASRLAARFDLEAEKSLLVARPVNHGAGLLIS
jgi:beta-ribofuranosylaminobenzene 5'-phosphate synthase